MNKEPMLSHDVYFTLNDNSPAQKDKLVQEAHTYLKDHPGVVFFAVGTRAEQLNRPVNDPTFDVALHVVFKTIKAHDDYQVSPRHHEFISRNKPNWKQIRVFDSLV